MKENPDDWWHHFCDYYSGHLATIKGEPCSWCGKEEVLDIKDLKSDREPFKGDYVFVAPTEEVSNESKEGDELLEIMMNLEQGRKYDGGKPQLYLLPPKSINEVGKVLTFGAEKYDPHNWRKVDDLQNRYSSAALRHMLAHIDGEDSDEETGLSHLAHAICCLMFKLEDELIVKSEKKRIRESNKHEHRESDSTAFTRESHHEKGSM